jgi:hypothetical protein
MKVLLLFIDGVGLGEDTETNPFSVLTLPHLTKLLGGRKLLSNLPAFQRDRMTFGQGVTRR